MQDNHNLITKAGGMGHFPTGFDRAKLAEVGKGYGIDIYRWMFAINQYESLMIQSFNDKSE